MEMRTPHKCITCKHYEPYHCTLNDAYIGYLDCDEPTKCRAWRKSAGYKKGGKFYEEMRKKGEMGMTVDKRITCQDCAFWEPGYIEGEDDFIPPMCRLHGKPAEANYYCEEGEFGNVR